MVSKKQCTLQRRCLSRRCLSPQARAVRRLPRRHQACIGRTAACGGCHRASASLAAPPPWQPRRFSPAPSAPPLQPRPFSTAPRQRRCTLAMALWGWRMCMWMHAAAPALPPPHPLLGPCRPCCAPAHLPVLPPSTWLASHLSNLSLSLRAGDSSPDEGEEAVDQPPAKGVAAPAPAEDDDEGLLGQQEEEEL